jgi:hypothetical protein
MMGPDFAQLYSSKAVRYLVNGVTTLKASPQSSVFGGIAADA